MKRKHISLKVKLAAALLRTTGLIKYEHSKQMTADQIISLFQWDHYPIPHAEGGQDEPWNLTPRLIAAHREKTRKVDVPTIEKGKRIRRKEAVHVLQMAAGMVNAILPENTSTHVTERVMSVDEARKLYPDLLLPHPDTTAPMPREVYNRKGRVIRSRGFDKTKTRGFNGKVRKRKKRRGNK